MEQTIELLQSFAYEAQSDDGRAFSGSIDAPNAEDAMLRLRALGLRVIRLSPPEAPARAAKSLRGEEFLAFNQQLAQLAAAGLPLERGLRLIADDMRGARQTAMLRAIADDLERGIELRVAFGRHRGNFPPLYGQLIEAGVRSGNLTGMLLNLGRHMEMVQRLRGALWRAVSYPLMVTLALCAVITFIGFKVLPQFEKIFADFKIDLPAVTEVVLAASRFAPAFAIAAIVAFVGTPIVWGMLKLAGRDAAVADVLLLPLPLIGPILRRNLVARWCDATRLGVMAGMDLPGAMEMAELATGSPRLRRDGQALIGALRAGKPLDQVPAGSILPGIVPLAIQRGCRQSDLPATLAMLSEMHVQQAELRIELVPAVLTPLLMLMIACVIGFVIAAIFLPLVTLIGGGFL